MTKKTTATTKTYYANIVSPTGGAHDLTIRLCDLVTVGRQNAPLDGPEALIAFVASHPEATEIAFTGMWMPQRPVRLPVRDLKSLARRQWCPPPRTAPAPIAIPVDPCPDCGKVECTCVCMY